MIDTKTNKSCPRVEDNCMFGNNCYCQVQELKVSLSIYDEQTNKIYKVKVSNDFYDDTTRDYTEKLQDKRIATLIHDIESVVCDIAGLDYSNGGQNNENKLY